MAKVLFISFIVKFLFVQKNKCLQQKIPEIFYDIEKDFKTLVKKEEISKRYCSDIIKFMQE